MKRLLCMISGLNAGGAETFLMKIYRAIDRERYQMDFCINVDGVCFYTEEIKSMGGKIYHIPSKSQSVKEFTCQLDQIIRKNHYEYVLRITSNAAGFMDLKIAKKAGAKICAARSSNSSDGDGLKVKIAHRLGRILYSKYVDVKFAPSDLAAQYTFGKRAYQKGDVAILHNGVDLNVFRYDKEAGKKIRDEFGISTNEKVIGHIGRFMKQKNHEFLIDIFAEIHQIDKDARFLLVGNGETEQQIRDKVKKIGLKECVIFAGVRSDIPQILSAMDVFLFPSLYEGMPNTVIEAQAIGLPCVISDTITRETDITGLVEYLSLDDSAKYWADTVIKHATDPKRKDTADDFKKKGYSIENVAEEFTKLLFERI